MSILSPVRTVVFVLSISQAAFVNWLLFRDRREIGEAHFGRGVDDWFELDPPRDHSVGYQSKFLIGAFMRREPEGLVRAEVVRIVVVSLEDRCEVELATLRNSDGPTDDAAVKKGDEYFDKLLADVLRRWPDTAIEPLGSSEGHASGADSVMPIVTVPSRLSGKMDELSSHGSLAQTVFVIPTHERIFLSWLRVRAARDAGIGIMPNLKHYHYSHLDAQLVESVAGSKEISIRHDFWDGQNWRRIPLVSINILPLGGGQGDARCEIWITRLNQRGEINGQPAEFTLWDSANNEYDRLVKDMQARWPETVVASDDGRPLEWEAWGGRLPGQPPQEAAATLASVPSQAQTETGTQPPPKRTRVFISYSHADADWLVRLQVHLKPLQRQGIVDLWDDTHIQSGARWQDEIGAAIGSARVALLLVSADFLASDFIQDNELPPLLEAADSQGAVIIPIIVSACRFEQTPALSRFQAINPPSRSLLDMSQNERERLLVEVSQVVERALSSASDSD